MFRKLIEIILNFPKLTILVVLIIVAFLGSGVRHIRIEESIKEMLPHDIPSRQTLSELEYLFGGTDIFMISVSNEETIFNTQTLAKIKAITDTLEMMPSVARVTSLSTINQIKSDEWGLEVTPFMEEVPETAAEIDSLRQRLFEDSTYIGQVVSANGKYGSVIAVVVEDAEYIEIYRELIRMRDALQGPEEIHLTGTPIIMSYFENSIKSDLRRLIPFVIVVVCVIMYLSFGTISGMALPLLTALLSTVSMVGLMGHVGKPFMVINNVMPVILIAVGVSYAIHIIAGYYDELALLKDKKEALIVTLGHVGKPVLLAGLTTIIGFLTMLSAPLPVYVDFGVFLAFGVLLATIITVTVIPAILVLLPVPAKKINKTRMGILDRLLDALGSFVPRHRKSVFLSGLVLIVIFAFGLTTVEMDMNPITFFRKNSSIRIADDKINQHLGGSVNMNLLFTGNIQSPQIMQAMDDVQQFLEQFPETGATISLATMVKKINRVMNDDDPRFEVVPETEEAIAQALLMYSMSGSPEDFEQFVDNSYENAQVIARIKSVSTKRTAVIADAVDKFCRDNLTDIEAVKTTGIMVFLRDLANLVITSQIRSLILSILLISIVSWITYRSFFIGVLSIIPVVVTVVLNFGLMGYCGIALSVPTAVISSIIIGIGIDFSFHFISRYKLELGDKSVPEAVTLAIRRVGKPILYDALPTACGFLVLLQSQFLPIRFLGFLISLTMMVCAIGALTILAAALTYTSTHLHK